MRVVRAAGLFGLAYAAYPNGPAADRIDSLPGWEGDLPSEWFSGFLDIGDTKQLHYVFTAADTNPETAPVTLWLNGGPGCSSLDGLFYEHGQLLVKDENTLVRNPYAFTTVSNMIYIEAPAGVGFSYRSDGKYKSDDAQTAIDNLAGLHAFFAKFPELKTHDFYVSGESYGGVYVPTLSQAILHDKTVDWNMKGLLVGNGVMSWDRIQKFHYPFLWEHGAMSNSQYAELDKTCSAGPDSEECQKLQNVVDEQTQGLNLYDIYRDCFVTPSAATLGDKDFDFQMLRTGERAPHPALVSAGVNVPCIDSVAGTAWLNKAEVKKAIHVDVSPNDWAICTSITNYDRNMEYSAVPIYEELVHHYRVLIYHGDTDMACDYLQGQDAIAEVARNQKLETIDEWKPWMIKDAVGPQVAGFITTYKTEQEFHFITVKGAGHMTPQWKPEASIAFFERFLNHKSIKDGGSEHEEVFVL